MMVWCHISEYFLIIKLAVHTPHYIHHNNLPIHELHMVAAKSMHNFKRNLDL